MEFPRIAEISDFKFRQLRKISIEAPSNYAVNLVAASNRFGLIFAGHSKGFKILHLETLLEVDSDPTKRANDASNEYASMEVQLGGSVSSLTLSCDELMLSVCVMKDNLPVALFYDVKSFSSQTTINGHFNEVRLSTNPGTNVMEFAWNPSIVEMFAVCLTDGSLTVYEVGNDSVKITGALPPMESVLSLCWSPKGKQLVAGKKDGSLAQYKPTLQLSKLIPMPSGFENPVSVASVCWLSTTLFAALYVPQNGDDNAPNLILVSVPKGTSPSYTNFGDICYGNGERPPRYWMNHLAEWKVLICSSANSLETTVIGMDDNQSWQQWVLEDTSRAELPLSKSEDTFPTGMSIIMCSQRRIIVSDVESYAPMPILLLLSTAGILCPFHILNLGAQAPALNSLPENLSAQGQPRMGKGLCLPQAPTPLSSLASVPLSQTTENKISGPVKANLMPRFTEESPKVSPSQPFMPPPQPFAMGKADSFINSDRGSSFGFAPVPGSHPNVPVQITGEPSRPESNPPLVSPKPTFMGEPVGSGASRKISRPVLTPVAPSKTTLAIRPGAPTPTEPDKVSMELTYRAALLDEIKEFDQEVLQTKALLQNCNYSVGTKDEMGKMRNRTQEVQEFCEGMKKTVQSLNLDIHTLKSCLLDTFSMLEDARSLDVRNKDPVYLALLRSRPLDPISSRKLKGIRQICQYLDSQIREVQQRLDQDWEDYLDKKKTHRSLTRKLPESKVIYQTLSNNLNAIRNLQETVDSLTSQMKEKKMTWAHCSRTTNQSYQRKSESESEDLASLADSLLHTRLNETEKCKKQLSFQLPKAISAKKENCLREFLSNRKVTTVKAKQISSLSESIFISPIKLLKDSAMIKEKIMKSAEREERPTQQDSSLKSQPSLIKEVTVLSTDNTAFQPVVSKPEATFQPVATEPATAPKGIPAPLITTAPKMVPHTVGGIVQGLPMTAIKPAPVMMPNKNEIPIKMDSKLVSSLSYVNSQTPPNVTLPFNAPLVLPTAVKPTIPSTVFVPTTAKGPATTAAMFSGSFMQTKPASSVLPLSSTVPLTGTSSFGFSKPLSTSQPPFSQAPPIISTSQPTGDVTNLQSFQFKLPPSQTPPMKSDFTFKLPQSQVSASPPLSFSQKPDQVPEKLVDHKANESQYEDVTPPETPQIRENDSSKEEETKIIEVNLNQGRDSGPTVKITSASQFSFTSPQASTSTSPFSLAHLSTSTAPSGLGTGLSAFTKQPTSSTKTQPTFQFSMPSSQTTAANKPMPNFSFSAALAGTPSPSVVSSTSKTPALVSETSSNEGNLIEPAYSSTSPTAESKKAPDLLDESEIPVVVDENSSSVASSTESEPIASDATSSDSVVKPASEVDVPTVSSPADSTTSSTSSASSPTTSIASITNPTVTTPASFSSTTTTTTTSLFGKRTSTSDVSDTTAAFTSGTPLFGSTSTPVATPQATSGSLFTQSSFTSKSAAPTFGQNAPLAGSIFGNAAPMFGHPGFGAPPSTTSSSSVFGSVPSTTSGFVGTPTATSTGSVFGTTPATTPSGPVFGVIPTTSTNAGFSAAPSTTAPIFGGTTATTGFGSPQPAFGQPASPGSGLGPFGIPSPTPAFGQSSLFGQPKQLFGQSNSANSSGVFGQPASPNSSGTLFGQPATNTSGSLFGSQTSFFGGLGAKPSAENANKNVFGSPSFQTQPSGSPGLFGSQGASTFGSSFGGQFRGSFSSGGTSVAQSGFGAFQQAQAQPSPQQQQQQTPTKTGGFGSPPSFGSPPVFGSSPSFGSSSAFGQNQPSFGSTFGGGTTSPGTFGSATASPSTFGNAATNPRFEALGSQAPSFSSLSPQGAQGENTGFNTTAPTFGSLSSFGGQQQQQQQQQQQSIPESKLKNFGSWSSLAATPSSGSPQGPPIKMASMDTSFQLFKKQAKEKQDRRQLMEAQEMRRHQKEQAEKERQRAEREKMREKEEEDALERARKSQQQQLEEQMARQQEAQAAAAQQQAAQQAAQQQAAQQQAQQQAAQQQQAQQQAAQQQQQQEGPTDRDRQKLREQERRRREAMAGQIDMNRQSDIMASFEGML